MIPVLLVLRGYREIPEQPGLREILVLLEFKVLLA